MASTVYDDTDPLISYQGFSWFAADAENSGDWADARYSNSTFHRSSTDGDYFFIAWEGTDVFIYGAKRNKCVTVFHVDSKDADSSSHGVYTVQVDGGDTVPWSGYSSTDVFVSNLYSTSGLSQGTHTLKMSNANSQNIAQYPKYVYFDLDSIAVRGKLINPFTPLKTGDPASGGTQSSPGSSAVQSTIAQSQPPAVQSSTAVGSGSSTSTAPAQSSQSSLGPSASPTSSGSQSASFISVSRSATQSMQQPSGGTGLLDQYTAPSAPLITSGGILTLTTGSPRITGAATPGNSGGAGSGSSGADHSGSGTSSAHTKEVAISVTVIVLAVLIILVVGGLWIWRRKRRAQSMVRLDQQDEYGGVYGRPASSVTWDRSPITYSKPEEALVVNAYKRDW